MNNNQHSEMYSIPLKFRLMENLHIVFWLFKDLAWCMFWRPLGLVMIVPTITIAAMITYNTRKITSELCHNLAVLFWISSNAYWMISEFFHFDEKIVFGNITFKHLAVIPFVMGIISLCYYYLYAMPKTKKASRNVHHQNVTQTAPEKQLETIA